MEEGYGHLITLTTRELPFCLVCRLQNDYYLRVQIIIETPQDRTHFRSLYTVI